MFRNENGFTLIEMIGVMALIGIIMAIGVVKHYQVIERTELTSAKLIASDLTNLEKRAWLDVKVKHGYWTDDLEVFEILQGNLEDDLTIDGGSLKGYKYIRHPSTKDTPGYWEVGGAL